MAKKKAIKRVFCFFVILAILMSAMPISIFAMTSNVTNASGKDETFLGTHEDSNVFSHVKAISLTSRTVSEAPKEEWNKTFGSTGDDEAWTLQQTDDGGYILAGDTLFETGLCSAWLVKTNSNGDMEWEETFRGTGFDSACSVQQTGDGGYILAGDTLFETGLCTAWLVKTNSQGDMEWEQTFRGTGFDSASSVRQTTDGGYILAGNTLFETGLCSAWLVKTNSQGDMEWEKTFGITGFDSVSSVQQTTDGGYILAGDTLSSDAGLTAAWLLKTNSKGEKEWEATFGGSGLDSAYSANQTADGGYILAGETLSFYTGLCTAWLVKTNSKGIKEWEKTYGKTGLDSAYAVQQTTDGGYVFAGETFSLGAYGWTDAWLVKTDSEGNKKWERTFGGSGDDLASAVQQTADGGYVIAGCTDSYGDGYYDAWLIKVKGTTGLTELPDLTLLSDDISFSNPSPAVGETVTITATIHNIGTTSANDVIVQFFDGDPCTGGIQIEDDQTIAAITAGGTGTAQVDWIATSGSHDIYVIADPYDDIPESDGSNNEAHINCKVEVLSGSLTLTVKNAAGESLPDCGGTIDVVLFDKDYIHIKTESQTYSGGESSVQVQFDNLANEPHFIEVYHTPNSDLKLKEFWGSGEVTVSDSTPKDFVRHTQVVYDVKINGESPYGNEIVVNAGEQVHVDITVKNFEGESKNVKARLILDRDKVSSYDFDDTWSWSIPQNEEDDFGFDCPLEEAGTYYFYIVIRGEYNSNYIVVDRHEWYKAVQRIPEIDSIKIVDIAPDAETELAVGEEVTFDLTVDYSLASSDWGSIDLSVIDNNGRHFLDSKAISAGSGTAHFTHSEVIQGGFPEDDEKFIVAVNLTNLDVVECVAEDSISYGLLFPDLKVEDITFSDNPKVGDPITITATIRNIGRANVGEFDVTFRNEDAVTPLTVLGEETIDGLMAGGSETVEIEWRWMVICGRNEISASADDDCQTLERNKDRNNNRLSKEINIECHRADDGRYTPGSKKALILAPYHWQGFIEYSDDLVDDLEEMEWQVDYKINDEVTIENFENWLNEGYGLIHITTHGKENGFAIESFHAGNREENKQARNERWGALIGRYGEESAKHMFRNDSDDAKDKPNIMVNGDFIRTRCNGLEKHPLVYFEACDMGSNDDMREAFISMGGGAYLGFEKEVAFCYIGGCTTITTAEDVSREFYRLTIDEGYTVGEAVDDDNFPLANGEGCSGYFDPPCVELLNYGNENLILVDPITVTATCPIDLVTTDPEGLIVSRESCEIGGATYTELDIADGDLDDRIIIPERKIGDYRITVIPEPDAEPTDTYTLKVSTEGTTTALAKSLLVRSQRNHIFLSPI